VVGEAEKAGLVALRRGRVIVLDAEGLSQRGR
jgi:hypothetical protein